MSEYTTKGRAGLDELEAVGRRLIVDGYLRGDSVLTPGQPIWSVANFQELKAIYVDSPDEGGRDFWDKLADQFDGASDGAIQLFAEIFLTNMLPLSSLLGRTKIGYLRRVLEMMEEPVAVPDDVVAATAVGAFHGGPGFNFGRYSQLWLLINFGLHLHTLSPAELTEIGEDPLAFRAALAAVKTPNQPMQRGALRYLAFPKFFLSIVNPVHRRLIRDTFVSYLPRQVSDDVDTDLFEINRAFEQEQHGPVDFYQEPWEPMWKPPKPPKGKGFGISARDDDVDEELDDESDSSVTEFSIVDPDQELADSLHVDLDWLARCTDLLRDRPQLIFYGPPGTGKTYIAKTLARHLAGPDNVTIVQFHPAYSYEDFFEGFRPTPHSDGQVGFELKPGPMRRLTDRARKHPDQLFVLVVDEINRGNLAKIFGELYFLLEYRDEAIDLMYSTDNAEPFTLPRNVVIIGTMNTADRSIALVDTAMRRRFGFIPLHPTQEPTKSVLRRWLTARKYPQRVADLHQALNAAIDDPDFQIGPSYFMRPAVHSDGGLAQVWDSAIIPLLEEFHFGDRTVDLEARYGLAALEKSLTAGE
ncbi:AAA family ATPase [Rhodococcus sp. (in: high G+C Gram-positive bacteria)]|uniref:McrB family protein n=1 Tax=Rhodococcus sp. TaxID=1831 RepID=UPI00257E433A|nr:AAA family ATPase [Rhodococcus sp. (in: high G+C Gram-positive bacteria)]MBQ9055515.1 AAA family ATPase [Rhodococcus sp. (in: high G+C Gram-positive bacteria)]